MGQQEWMLYLFPLAHAYQSRHILENNYNC